MTKRRPGQQSKTSLARRGKKAKASPSATSSLRGKKTKAPPSATSPLPPDGEKAQASASTTVVTTLRKTKQAGGAQASRTGDGTANTRWSKEQEDLLLEVYETEREKTPDVQTEHIIDIFQARSDTLGMKHREKRACARKIQRLGKTNSDYKWTTEQLLFVGSLLYESKQHDMEIARSYETERHTRDPVWPERKRKAIRQRLDRFSEEDFKRLASPAEQVSVDHRWLPEEDTFLVDCLQHTREQLKEDQRNLDAFMRSRGIPFKSRSMQAISNRITELKKMVVDGTVQIRRQKKKVTKTPRTATKRMALPLTEGSSSKRQRRQGSVNAEATVVLTTGNQDVDGQLNSSEASGDQGSSSGPCGRLWTFQEMLQEANGTRHGRTSVLDVADALRSAASKDLSHTHMPVGVRSVDTDDLGVTLGNEQLPDVKSLFGLRSVDTADTGGEAQTAAPEEVSALSDLRSVDSADTSLILSSPPRIGEEQTVASEADGAVEDGDRSANQEMNKPAAVDATSSSIIVLTPVRDLSIEKDAGDVFVHDSGVESGELCEAITSLRSPTTESSEDTSCDPPIVDISCDVPFGPKKIVPTRSVEQAQLRSVDLADQAQSVSPRSEDLADQAQNVEPRGRSEDVSRRSAEPAEQVRNVAAHPTASFEITVRGEGRTNERISGKTMQYIVPTKLRPDSRFRQFLADVASARAQLQTSGLYDQVVIATAERFDRFYFSEDRLRELLFVIPLVCRNKIVTSILLRELWSTSRSSSYGNCRDENCCLQFDVSCPDYSHEGSCRHWRYLERCEVYLDSFSSVDDYRLALALSTHMEAFWATHETRIAEERERAQWEKVSVGAYGPLDMAFKKWGEKENDDHARHAFKLMSCVRICQNTLNDAAHLDFGDLRWTSNEGVEEIVSATLLSYQGLFFVTYLSLDKVSAKGSRLEWRKLGTLVNYVRRFMAIDHAVNIPLLEYMADRRICLTPHPQSKIDDIVRHPVYMMFKRELDDDQGKVMHAFVTQDGIHLNQGPFGCGKTTTISATAIMYILAHPGEKVAIVSEANTAIDEDLKRLIKRMDVINQAFPEVRLEESMILRLGDTAPGMDEYGRFYLKVQQDRLRKVFFSTTMSKKACAIANRKLKVAEKSAIANARIFVATLSQLGRENFRDLNVRAVINDEGAQTPEAALVQALYPNTRNLQSVGDTHQLPAFSNLPEMVKFRFERDGQPHKNRESLLHSIPTATALRTPDAAYPGVIVHSVYRCHPQITSWLQAFYDDFALSPTRRLRSNNMEDYLSGLDLTIGGRVPRLGIPRLGSDHVLWLGPENAGCHQRDEKYNLVEIALAVVLVLKIKAEIKQQNLPNKTVYIITPYREQRARIECELKRLHDVYKNYVDVGVFTTDSSQGREADVVIVSMTRFKSMGFLQDSPERTLVSFSRARDYLFVLSNRHVFQEDKHWQKLHAQAAAIGLTYEHVEWDDDDAQDILADVPALEEAAWCDLPRHH